MRPFGDAVTRFRAEYSEESMEPRMIGMDVERLYSHGRTIADRSAHGGKHSTALIDSLDAAAGVLGHPEVKAALRRLTGTVQDPAVKLPGLITAVGNGVGNTAATARNSDDEGARDVRVHTDVAEGGALDLVNRINRPSL